MAWMDDADRLEAKGLARAKIRAKRRRVQTIRRRTLRGSLALFAVVWAFVFAQLVSGNDPALSRVPQASRQARRRDRTRREPTPEPELEEEEPALEAEPVPKKNSSQKNRGRSRAEEEVAPEPEPEPVITSAS